jgi:excisionase family DNA binding protein
MLEQHNQYSSVPKLLFSRKECAHALGCGLSKIDEAIKDGSLSSFLWGRDRKIHHQDLIDFSLHLRRTVSDKEMDV